MLSYYMNQFKAMLYIAPGMLIAISFHEFAHGYVSYKMGDPTPKRDGRLTLNPFKHLDLMGTLCLLLFHMGWAKPVRINTACYKNKKKGTILVSLAGPAMNFLLAFLSMVIYGLLYQYGITHYTAIMGSTVLENVYGIGLNVAYYASVINVGLGVFNLIPFPPLDGSNVLAEIVPKVKEFYFRTRRYSNLVLIVLLVTGILSRPLGIIDNAILNGMWSIVKSILRIGIPGTTNIYI